MAVAELLGKSYIFEDGNAIEVIQVKKTDPDRGHLIKYLIHQGSLNLPRKLVMSTKEFNDSFGHLFDVDLTEDDIY
jgi:hypothetical protein